MDKRKHDPLDPLEQAYYSSEGNSGKDSSEESQPQIAGELGKNEIFQGEPLEEGAFTTSSPPPPPPLSPFQNITRFIPFALGLLIIVLLIYFASRFFNKEKGSGELTYWVLWEEESVLKPLIEDYERQNPNLKIKFIRQTSTQYRERLQAYIARGEGPDIFRFHNTWVPMLRSELAPLPKDIISSQEFQQTYYPVMVEDLQLGGDTVGIPLMYEGLLVFYNPEILQAVGYTTPADNWDDFLVQADELTSRDENGKITTAGAALGRADNIEHFADILGLLMLQNGASPAKPNSEAGIGALTFYRLFAQTPDNFWSSEFKNDIVAFAEGKVAMIFAPSWEAFTIQAINQNLNFKTARVPQVKGTQTPLAWASYWVEGVNSRSPNQKEAWKFLKFLAEKENLEKFYTLASNNRSFGEPYPRKEMGGTMTGNPYLSALIKDAEIAKSFYMASRTFDNGINDHIIQYYRTAIDSLDQGNSPDDALDTASQGIQQVLQSYNVQVK